METHAFQAETQKLLGLMIHSLYSNKEVFLRELVSNASDALDRRRFEALKNPALQADAELAIELVADRPARVLTIADNGIGMSRAEVIEHLGTIARSGTLEFLKRAGDAGEGAPPDLIGQFGVGFYASFMVADEVEVVTRKAGEATATRWISKGAGEYGIEEATRETAGTTIRLHLKAVDGEAGISDFCDEWVLKQVIRKYSDFVAHPIRLTIIEGSPPEAETQPEAADGARELPTRRTLDAPLNSMKAIWTRAESEVSAEEFDAFYEHLTRDAETPLLRVATAIEGTFEARALLFVPSRAPYDLYHRERLHNGVQLYVRRVFIMDECRELLPEWLRFVRGVVDAEDLSLNVSREMLQQDRQIQAIRKHLVKKLVERLKKLLGDDRATYEKFWAQFGPVVKEGLLDYREDRERVLELVLAPSSKDETQLVSLAEYVDRMPASQETIYYLAGPKLDVLRRSPHLEAFAAQGIEVLFFVDPVDEVWLGQGPPPFREKSFQSIGHGEALLGSDAEKEKKKEALEKKEADLSSLLQAIRSAIQDDVKEVRLSSRLTSSAACLVHEDGDLSPALEAMLRQAGQPIPERKPILELNPDHAVVARLEERFAADPADERVGDAARLLFGQAVLAEGGQLEDPSGFAVLVNKLLAQAL